MLCIFVIFLFSTLCWSWFCSIFTLNIHSFAWFLHMYWEVIQNLGIMHGSSDNFRLNPLIRVRNYERFWEQVDKIRENVIRRTNVSNRCCAWTETPSSSWYEQYSFVFYLVFTLIFVVFQVLVHHLMHIFLPLLFSSASCFSFSIPAVFCYSTHSITPCLKFVFTISDGLRCYICSCWHHFNCM